MLILIKCTYLYNIDMNHKISSKSSLVYQCDTGGLFIEISSSDTFYMIIYDPVEQYEDIVTKVYNGYISSLSIITVEIFNLNNYSIYMEGLMNCSVYDNIKYKIIVSVISAIFITLVLAICIITYIMKPKNTM